MLPTFMRAKEKEINTVAPNKWQLSRKLTLLLFLALISLSRFFLQQKQFPERAHAALHSKIFDDVVVASIVSGRCRRPRRASSSLAI